MSKIWYFSSKIQIFIMSWNFKIRKASWSSINPSSSSWDVESKTERLNHLRMDSRAGPDLHSVKSAKNFPYPRIRN